MKTMLRLSPLLIATGSATAQTCAPTWRPHEVNGPVQTLYVDNQSDTLYIGGDFTAPAPYLASLHNGTFATVDPSLDGEIHGIAMHDDESGRTLYVTGNPTFDLPNGWIASIARLENGVFRTFGADTVPFAWLGHLVSYDLGMGPRLAVTGGFGVPCSYATQWNGTAWECMGDGLETTYEDAVLFDDGRGPAVFFCGGLLMRGLPFSEAFGAGRWDGHAWSTLAGGLNGSGMACAIFDSGEGPEFIVAGGFTRAGNTAVSHIARWNGVRWASLGSGLGRNATAMAVFDDGSGTKLYVAGDFTSAGGQPADRLARWDGSRWSACPAGGLPSGRVESMKVFDTDGPGPARASLFLGGEFTRVGTTDTQNLAELIPGPLTADITGDGFIDFLDYTRFVTLFETGDPASDRTNDRFIDFFDYDDFVAAFESGC